MHALTRRQFLGTAATTAVGSLLPVGTMVARDKPVLFGLVTYLWGEKWDLPTLLKNCEASGLLGVELRTTHAHGVEPSLDASQRAEVKQRFADSPVTLLGLGSNENFDSPDPAVVATAIRTVKDFLQLSHDVGGSGVKVKPNDFHPEIPREKTLEQIGKSLREVAVFADELGQEVRMEVHGGCAHLPDMQAIAAHADHPRARLCWNSNSEDLEDEGLEHNFGLVRPHFGQTLHVHELGDPKYPYERLAALLVESAYPGWVLLEASSKPADPVAAMAEQRALWEIALAKAPR